MAYIVKNIKHNFYWGKTEIYDGTWSSIEDITKFITFATRDLIYNSGFVKERFDSDTGIFEVIEIPDNITTEDIKEFIKKEDKNNIKNLKFGDILYVKKTNKKVIFSEKNLSIISVLSEDTHRIEYYEIDELSLTKQPTKRVPFERFSFSDIELRESKFFTKDGKEVEEIKYFDKIHKYVYFIKNSSIPYINTSELYIDIILD